MNLQRETLLCQYRYDGLDRLVGNELPDRPTLQRFYCKSRLATEIQGAMQHSIIQHDDLLLAQQQRQGGGIDTTLLATDLQRSVLHTLKTDHPPQPIAYSPYGHRSAFSGLLSLLGFNGERQDPVTEHYLLGNGYRAYNPVLMRFNSPDSWSPFGKGGLNPYTYCVGDTINRRDPSGHFSQAIAGKLLAWAERAKDRLSISFARKLTPPKSSATYLTNSSPPNNNTFSTSTFNWSDPQLPTLKEKAIETLARLPPKTLSAEDFPHIPKKILDQITERKKIIKEATETSVTFKHYVEPHLERLGRTGQLARTPEELIALSANITHHESIITDIELFGITADSAREMLSNLRNHNNRLRPWRLMFGEPWRPF